MAVTTTQNGSAAPTAAVDPGSRRVLVGANVALTVVLAALLVGFLQFMGSLGGFVDMTSSAVNSVSPPTRKLLADLPMPIRITSLYARTDIESADQAKYRAAVNDLLSLFEACNRSKISKEWINPLQDHDKRRALVKRLQEKKRFQDQIASVTAAINHFRGVIQPAVIELIAREQSQIDAIAGLGGQLDPLIGNVRQALAGLEQELSETNRSIDEYTTAEVPSYSAARSELRTINDLIQRQLEAIARSGPEYVRSGRANLPPSAAEFLNNARGRYQEVMALASAQRDELDKASKLDIEDVISALSPTANSLLVETDEDAKVVRFDEIWPPIREGSPGDGAGFHQRAFKGEEKLASAILRVTHREQTAVVFVHYGGMPLFFGGFQGLPQAPYAKVKVLLEDANFVVSDWDLKTDKQPPAIDPKPTRIIYIVLKPESPNPNQMQMQEAPWGDEQQEALLAAFGENPRALFIAGWHPGPFGPLPSSYEFNDYLDKNWGLRVDTGQILLRFRSISPGRYLPADGVFSMEDVELGQHDIVARLHSDPMSLPFCAPVTRTTVPEGVTLTTLVTAPRRDGIWGVRSVQKYEEQAQSGRGYFTRVEGDTEGPFDIAVAGTRGDAKIVLVSSRNFAEDRVAFNARMALTSQGLTMYMANPGNSGLLLNALHWLNDNTAFMDLGRPIQMNTLRLPSESAVKGVRVVALLFMPLLTIGAGLAVMFARRR